MNKSMSTAAEQYFSNINPIATRIYADFQDTRNAYDCVWETLSFDEQTQVLNECIIKPEVTLQYNLKPSSSPVKVSKESYGRKTVVDENVSYRDEHSAPFSFKTSSQVDLRVFASNVSKKQISSPKIDLPIKQKQETQKVEAPLRYKMDTNIFNKILGRRNSPDSEQEVLVSPEEVNINVKTPSNNSLPKTGLDFLDNW